MQKVTWDAKTCSSNLPTDKEGKRLLDDDKKEIVLEIFSGTVQVMLPNYINKMKLIKKCDFKIQKSGEAEINMDQLDSIIILAEESKNYVKEVDVLHIPSGKKAGSYEDLLNFPEFEAVATEVFSVPLSGGNVGNS